MPRPAPIRRLAAVSLAVAASLALAGCVGPTPAPTQSASPAPSASGSATTTPTGTRTPTSKATAIPTPTPTPAGTPVTLTCDQLITPQQAYDFNPNYGTDPGYVPKAGTLPDRIRRENGRTCGLLNQSSGEVIEIAVGTPAAATLTALKNAAIMDSTPVPTYGIPPTVEGYFVFDHGVGTAQIFQGRWWVVIRSSALQEPGDVAPLAADVQGNLPAS